tara:strand:- start:72 stop:926 length:855 start_codon:yes stop_codon:yes gene_type:complete
MGKDGFHWFVGVVESRNDPSQIGRVQVRVLGHHTENKNAIPTEDLPWATVMMPTTSPANSGLGTSPSFIVEGSWVVGFFMDVERQQPIIMGTLPGVPNQEVDSSKGYNDPNGTYPLSHYLNESDVNKLARGDSTRLVKVPDTETGEPANPYNAVYPKNHVFESESGHVIEIDDTTDAERIHIYHKSGSFVEFHPNGDVVTQHKNGFKTVTGNDKIHVTGDLTIKADGNITIDSGTGKTINLNSGTKGAARVGDTADTGDDPPGISGSDGSNVIETGSTSVIIGD